MRKAKLLLDNETKYTYNKGMKNQREQIKAHNKKTRAMKSRNTKKLKKLGRLI